jgi:hypothetical protein
MQTAQIKSEQRKSRVHSANKEKTVQIKRKQCKQKANSTNQMQTVQIKCKQCKSKTNSVQSQLPSFARPAWVEPPTSSLCLPFTTYTQPTSTVMVGFPSQSTCVAA